MPLAATDSRPVRAGPADRPVLAVVDLNAPAEPVLARAAAAAEFFGCPAKLVLIAPRPGVSTDAALVARAHWRLRDRLDQLLTDLRRRAPHLTDPVADLAWYGRRPLGSPERQAQRAARAVAQRYHARIVILPAHLQTPAGDALPARVAPITVVGQ